MELNIRLKAYEGFSDKFGFLQNFNLLTANELQLAAKNYWSAYESNPDDLDGEPQSELVHFAAIIDSLTADKFLIIGKCYAIDVFLQLKENELLEAFPNVYTTMCIQSLYLCCKLQSRKVLLKVENNSK